MPSNKNNRLVLKNYTPLQRRILFSACIGNILKWYDFTLCAVLAYFFAPVIFPNASYTLFANGCDIWELEIVFFVFCIGYFFRSVGALIFSHLSDTQGRKKSLIIAILLMTIGTFGMGFLGLLPVSHSDPMVGHRDTIVGWGSILLLILRLIQGIGVGGEAFTSVGFAIESLPPRSTSFYPTLLWSSSIVGVLLAGLISLLTLLCFKEHLFETVGWRLPFLFSIVIGGMGYSLLAKMSETPVFKDLESKGLLEKNPLKTVLSHYKYRMVKLSGIYFLSTFLTIFAFVLLLYQGAIISATYANGPLDLFIILLLPISLAILLGGLTIFFGGLSDRVGEKPILLTAACSCAILAYPLYYAICYEKPLMLGVALIPIIILVAAFQGPLRAFTTNLDSIPTNLRFTVSSLAANLSYFVMGILCLLLVIVCYLIPG